MKRRYINATAFVVIVLAVGFGSLYLGQHFRGYSQMHSRDSGGWHQVLHDKLHITTEQEIKLADTEKRYRQRRQAQGFKEVTVSLNTVSQERLRRLGLAHGKTRQEVVPLALLAAERLLEGELITKGGAWRIEP